MNTRGQGRVYQRSGSPFWYVAYYAHGKEQREAACHVRTGAKLEATEKNHREAERFLKQAWRNCSRTAWRANFRRSTAKACHSERSSRCARKRLQTA